MQSSPCNGDEDIDDPLAKTMEASDKCKNKSDKDWKNAITMSQLAILYIYINQSQLSLCLIDML